MITSPGCSMTLASLSPFLSRSPRRSAYSRWRAGLLVEADQLGAVAARRIRSGRRPRSSRRARSCWRGRGCDAGFSVAPTTRTCWLKVPANLLTITDHQRLGDVLRQLQADVLRQHRRGLADRRHVGDQRRGDAPVGADLDARAEFGLRQTWMVSSSSGPITYSSPGPSCIATKRAGGSCGPPPPRAARQRQRGDSARRREGGRNGTCASMRPCVACAARRRTPGATRLRRRGIRRRFSPKRVNIPLGLSRRRRVNAAPVPMRDSA